MPQANICNVRRSSIHIVTSRLRKSSMVLMQKQSTIRASIAAPGPDSLGVIGQSEKSIGGGGAWNRLQEGPDGERVGFRKVSRPPH